MSERWGPNATTHNATMHESDPYQLDAGERWGLDAAHEGNHEAVTAVPPLRELELGSTALGSLDGTGDDIELATERALAAAAAVKNQRDLLEQGSMSGSKTFPEPPVVADGVSKRALQASLRAQQLRDNRPIDSNNSVDTPAEKTAETDPLVALEQVIEKKNSILDSLSIEQQRFLAEAAEAMNISNQLGDRADLAKTDSERDDYHLKSLGEGERSRYLEKKLVASGVRYPGAGKSILGYTELLAEEQTIRDLIKPKNQ